MLASGNSDVAVSMANFEFKAGLLQMPGDELSDGLGGWPSTAGGGL